MSSVLEELKHNLVTNGKVNTFGTLFTIAEPFGCVGIYIAYKHALETYENTKIFNHKNLQLSILLFFAFCIRLPYMWDQPLARVLLSVNIIGWFIVSMMYIDLYVKINARKNNNTK